MSERMEELVDAIAVCIVGCEGRRNTDRALAVLEVIEEHGWRLVPPEEGK